MDEAKTAVNDSGETLVIVALQDVGLEYSNLTVVLNEVGQIAGYSEAHFDGDEDSGHVTAWLNGEKVRDDDVVSNGGTDRSVGDAVSELNRCLSDAGIPAWIIAAATAVCSFGSLPGYIACLTAVGVGGGTAGYCVGSAWNKL